MSPRLDWGVATNAGRVRSRNEDRLLARPPLFAVADGMGGHSNGDVASSLAVETLEQYVGAASLDRDGASTAIAHANRRILDAAGGAQGADAMGTTLTGLVLEEFNGVSHWLVFNIGDSRIYRWHEGSLAQLTVDHSEVQELIRSGEMAPETARTHELRNVITRSLGSDPMPEIDWWQFPVVPAERFVVCSDGLSLELTDTDIERIVSDRLPAGTTATKLVEDAVAAGGRDNVSVIVVDVLADERSEADEDTSPRSVIVERPPGPEPMISRVPV